MMYPMFYFDPSYVLILIGLLLSMAASAKVNSTYARYARVGARCGMTGAEAAKRLLNSQGIYDVTVRRVPGKLTDHYDPRNKTVNLSESVYGSTSIAAIGVAAHECGHAVQHARGYAPLTLRSQLVPIVQFSSTAATWVIILGLVILATTQNELLCWIGVGLIAMSAVFSLDAARRIQRLGTRAGMAAGQPHDAGRPARTSPGSPLVGSAHLPRSSPQRHRLGALLGFTDPRRATRLNGR